MIITIFNIILGEYFKCATIRNSFVINFTNKFIRVTFAQLEKYEIKFIKHFIVANFKMPHLNPYIFVMMF